MRLDKRDMGRVRQLSRVLRSFSAGIACCLSASVVRPTSFLLGASWRGGVACRLPRPRA